MPYHYYRFSLVPPLCLVFFLGACQGQDKDRLADVNGAVITAQDVDRAGGRQLFRLSQQLYNLQRQTLDELINAQLLREEAKRQGVSVEVLLKQEVNTKVLPVTEEDIVALYKANRERIPVELDKVRNQIRDVISEQKLKTQRTLFTQSLRERAKIVTYLKPPPIHRVDVLTNGAPAKGEESAPVKIVKFEDFECPFCKTVQSTLADLLKKYEGKVRLVHKDLPLEAIHPQATLAAEAARCAGDQGKFWQYHDVLYSKAPKLGSAELKGYAKELGLDTASFDKCLGSGRHKAAVQKDLNEGAKLGLTGTPSFFINGRELSGAQPLEAFAAIIDEELAQAN